MAIMYPSKKAATPRETSLWTNSNPTSLFYSGQIALSDDMTNYDYIKITFRYSTSDSHSVNIIADVSGFLGNTDDDPHYAVVADYNVSTTFLRKIRNTEQSSSAATDSITITEGVKVTYETYDYDASCLIPTQVIGIKY